MGSEEKSASRAQFILLMVVLGCIALSLALMIAVFRGMKKSEDSSPAPTNATPHVSRDGERELLAAVSKVEMRAK